MEYLRQTFAQSKAGPVLSLQALDRRFFEAPEHLKTSAEGAYPEFYWSSEVFSVHQNCMWHGPVESL